MDDKTKSNTTPVGWESMTLEERQAYVRQNVVGGYIPFSPNLLGEVLIEALGYNNLADDLKHAVSPDVGEVGSPMDTEVYAKQIAKRIDSQAGVGKKGGSDMPEMVAVIAAAPTGKLGEAARKIASTLSKDKITAWAKEYPELGRAVKAYLEKGGMSWQELLTSPEGRAIIVDVGRKVGAKIGEHSAIDNGGSGDSGLNGSKSAYQPAADDSESVGQRDEKYEEVLTVLKALNITSYEYGAILNGIKTHTQQDIVNFRVARERYGLQRM